MWYEYDPPHTHTQSTVYIHKGFFIYKSSTWIIIANICSVFVHNLDPFVMQLILQSVQKDERTAWSYLVSDIYIHKKKSLRTVRWQPRPICHLTVSEDVLRLCVIRSWSSSNESCQCRSITQAKDASHKNGPKRDHTEKLILTWNLTAFSRILNNLNQRKCYNVKVPL